MRIAGQVPKCETKAEPTAKRTQGEKCSLRQPLPWSSKDTEQSASSSQSDPWEDREDGTVKTLKRNKKPVTKWYLI